ncbi:Hypothetical Protein FCC1311_113272 [Hondaea fermentalgiana]|uniref:Protein kinase domain-containing protein n=1 Tax=Hondaea fermentalgiana TaxID=2315210 RepID=A0A2R5H3U7_9STRA|nr:Hypothetical Protein FCC1311_113272 [Hondaea fermentalgiana]|eukprot:GBG35104.1 Hypothetical Protein FCC1311_113272 [Hondaea fermentalgiana]
MCEQVVNAPPPSSSGRRPWGLEFQRIGHWEDFASSMDIGGAIGDELSIDAGAFLTRRSLDASESEAGCAMLMYARSGDPPLRNVFWHRDKPFNDVKVSLKFEYITVAGARPDQLWLVGEDNERRPLLVHEHKSPAAFPGRSDRVAEPTSIWVTANSQTNVRKVLEQAYGYMIALGMRYSAIGTTEFTWFLKRDDDDRPGAEQPAGLLVSRPYECTGEIMESVHIGYLTALLHALRAGDAARDQFPAHDSPLGQHISKQWRAQLGDTNLERGAGTPYERDTYNYLTNIKNGSAASGGPGGLLPLHRSAMADLLPVPYDKAYERVRESAASSVLRLRRPDGLDFIIKTPVVGASDGLTAAEAVDAVVRETDVYAALSALQGSTVPPLVYGGALMSEDDGGWHAVITLDVGTSLDQLEAPLDKEVQTRALAALARVHAAGCLHGDVALRNFVLCPNTGAVRVIDFARAELVRAESAEAKSAAAAEMAELRECLGLAPADASSQSQPGPGQASSSTRDSA